MCQVTTVQLAFGLARCGSLERVPVDVLDDRRVEVIANGHPVWGRAPPLFQRWTHLAGRVRVYHRRVEGAALRIARRAKERAYHELVFSDRCRLVVLAFEVGGR